MSCRRIQKLLYSSEYSELEDIVLLESPFAEITPDGKGIRQMQIAITPTKLILAQDIFDESTPEGNSIKDDRISFETVAVPSDLDAEIESLELVSIIPINLVSLSLFVKGKKRALKARLRNGRTCYFELGGSNHRKMLWELWSDKVRCLSPAIPISSSSETSTSNSSSLAKACIQKKCSNTTSFHKSKFNSKCPEETKISRSCKSNFPSKRKPWTDRNLFPTEIDDDGKGENLEKYQPSNVERSPQNLLRPDQCKGDSADKNNDKFSWSISKEVELNLINEREVTSFIPSGQKSAMSEIKESQRSILVHRFDSGVSENCELGLYLVPLDMDESKDNNSKEFSSENFINLMDSGVRLWEEGNGSKRKRKSYSLHSHYLAAFSQFDNGLGPIGNYLSLIEKHLLQLRHASSSVHINSTDTSEIGFLVPKHQLTATISCDNLTLPFIEVVEKKRYETLLRKFPCTPLHSASIQFWMPDLVYHSMSANNSYTKQRRMLENIHGNKFCTEVETEKVSSEMSCTTLYRRHTGINKSLNGNDVARRRKYDMVYEKEIKRKICISSEKNFGYGYNSCQPSDQNEDIWGRSLITFQPMLKFRIKITAWDFTSTALAYQLTMLDRDLFLQIPVSELGLIIYQKCHLKEKSFFYPFTTLNNGTPCISALISFSHRISCLVSSAILEGKCMKVRARLMIHFINIAHKCFQLQNFQSCCSILFGLQSPAIFRLTETWKHIKRKYYNKYEIFKHLCRFYANVQLTGYGYSVKNSRRLPFLPSINFILNYIQEIKANIETENETYIAKPYKESEQKSNIDIQNAVTEKDTKRCKQQSDEPNNENAQKNAPKSHSSKLLNFLSAVFRINRRKINSQQQLSGTKDTHSEKSPKTANNYHAQRKSNVCFCWKDITDEKLKLGPDDKDWLSSGNLNSENSLNFHWDVGYSYESACGNRMEIFKRTAETLVSSQYCAYNYSLPQSDLAKEYLLKAKYNEHQLNYKLSLEVENS